MFYISNLKFDESWEEFWIASSTSGYRWRGRVGSVIVGEACALKYF